MLALGLVNNMSGAAFEATERQFVSLLEEASDDMEVSLSLYTLPGREACHRDTAALLGTELDGLLVTGREPLTADLRDEPWWPDFVTLLDWAREHTLSTVWSCLAAHAAVLRLSGIERRRGAEKHSGLFACTRVAAHPLTAGLPWQFSFPHSRWNGLREDDLTRSGYRILTRTEEGEVDTFIRQERSLFVFIQGHPEYDADTLLREYRRDVGRYLRRQSDTYPSIPRDTFAPATRQALAALREQALSSRGEALSAHLSDLLEAASPANTWREAAVALYRDWLRDLCLRKQARQAAQALPAFGPAAASAKFTAKQVSP